MEESGRMVFRDTKEVVNQLRLVCLDHKPAPESATNRHHLLKPQSKHRWAWVGGCGSERRRRGAVFDQLIVCCHAPFFPSIISFNYPPPKHSSVYTTSTHPNHCTGITHRSRTLYCGGGRGQKVGIWLFPWCDA